MAFFSSIGILGVIITLLLSNHLSIFFNDSSISLDYAKNAFIVLGISTALNFPASVFSAIITSYEKFNIINIFNFFSLALRVAIIVYFINKEMGLVIIAIATLLESFLRFLLNFTYIKLSITEISLKIKYIDRFYFNKILKYGLTTIVIVIADILKFNLDNFVIAKFLSVKDVGIYGIAAGLIGYLLSFMSALFNVLSPRFARLIGTGDSGEKYKLFYFSMFLSSYISFGALVTLYFFGGKVIILWVGNEFVDSILILYFFIFAYSIAMAQGPSIRLLYAEDKHHALAKLSILEGVFNIILSIILVSRYGIMGVCLGTIIPMLFIKILYHPIYICRILKLSYLRYYKTILLPLSCALFMISLNKIFKFDQLYFFRNDLLSVIIGIFIISIIYSILVYLITSLLEKDYISFVLKKRKHYE